MGQTEEQSFSFHGLKHHDVQDNSKEKNYQIDPHSESLSWKPEMKKYFCQGCSASKTLPPHLLQAVQDQGNRLH